MKGLHVLLADDNENMRILVSAILKGAGARRVHACANGYEAVLAVSRHPIDVAIIDFNMKPVDGLEFTRFMRRSPLSPDPYLPIILMTGHADRRRVLKARDVGVHEVLVKPVTTKALLGRFQAVLGEPRDFVKAPKYFGPDRRRMDVDFKGPYLRQSDRQLVEAAPPAPAPVALLHRRR